MSTLKRLKLDAWAAQSEAGIFDIDRYAAQAATPCVNGKAGEYACNNVDLVSFLRHQDMGSSTRRGNDIWGEQDTGPPKLELDISVADNSLQAGLPPRDVSLPPSGRRTARPLSRSRATARSSTSDDYPPKPPAHRGAT
jgi:hypothetical protein